MAGMTTTRHDDSTGIGAGQDAGRSEFMGLLAAHHAVGLALALRLLGNHDDAEDAVQEALIKAFAHRAQLAAVHNVRAFWLAIVYHQCLDARRRASTRRAHEVLQRPSSTPAADERCSQRDMLQRIREVLAELPSKQQAVLHLRLYEDLDYETIGRALDLSPRSARVYLVKARAHLRARLRRELEP